MANESVGENRSRKLTAGRRSELAAHNFTMDFETSEALCRAHAVLKLIEECDACARDIPAEIPRGVEAARALLHGALVRAGIA